VGPEATALRDRIAALTKADGQHHSQPAERSLYRYTGLGALVMCGTTTQAGRQYEAAQSEPAQYRATDHDQDCDRLRSLCGRAGRRQQFFPDRKIKAFDILSYVQQMKE
jgi:hypothetical protein